MLDPGIDVFDFALVDCSDGDRRVDAGKTTSCNFSGMCLETVLKGSFVECFPVVQSNLRFPLE